MNHNSYITVKRAKFKTISGEVNIPYGTKLEVGGNVLLHNGKPVCAVFSDCAYEFFAQNDDGQGLLRGKLIQTIKSTLAKHDEAHQDTKTVPISTLNSWAETFSNILGIPVYWHSLRHFFTTSLAKANLPDSVIKAIIGWESLEMVDIYKDIDDEDEIGKYCMNGEIVGQKQAALSDL